MDEEKKTTKTPVKKKTETTKTTTKSTAKKTNTTKKASTPAKKTSPKKTTTTKGAATKGSTKTSSSKSVTKVTPKKTSSVSTTKKTGIQKEVSVKKPKEQTTSLKKTAPKQEKPKKITSDANEVISKKVLEEVVLPVEEPKEESPIETKEVLKEEPIYETRKTIKKVIPVSNYLLVAIIVVWVIIIAYVGYELSRRHQENLYQEGYFIHEKIDVKQISLEEAKNIAQKSTDATFILFNYRGYQETYELEKDIWKIMKDYHLEANFYYVDLTDENGTLNCDMTCVLNTGLQTTKFKNAPAIAYYGRGTLVDIAQREDQKILEAADFVKLLDMYEFRK